MTPEIHAKRCPICSTPLVRAEKFIGICTECVAERRDASGRREIPSPGYGGARWQRQRPS